MERGCEADAYWVPGGREGVSVRRGVLDAGARGHRGVHIRRRDEGEFYDYRDTDGFGRLYQV
mgnify:FL=1